MISTTTARPAPVRRRGRVAALVLVYALPLVCAVLVTRPQVVGLSDVTGPLHLNAFPLVRGVAWLGLAVLIGAVTLFVRRRYLVWLVLVAVLAGGLDTVTAAVRGLGRPLPAARAGDVTAVTVNTLNETTTPEQVGRLVLDRHALVVAMPESTRPYAERVAARLAERGVRMQVFGGEASPPSWGSVTSLLVSTELGRYEQVRHPEPVLDLVLAKPTRGTGPTIAAVHSPPPFVSLSAPRAWEGIWRAGAARAAELCADGGADVVLGDLNTTLDHEPLADLGGCVDAAAEAGAGAAGTWPASAPAAFAAPIDHVFVDDASWRVTGVEVRRVGGSDHRAVVARLRPR